MYLRYFIVISLWKRVWPFIWTKFKPHYLRMLCVKLGWIGQNGSWERFLNFVIVFLLFRNYLPIGIGCGPSYVQISIPTTPGHLVPSLVEIGPVVLEKKIKMWKVYLWQQWWTTDKFGSEKLIPSFGSGELKSHL